MFIVAANVTAGAVDSGQRVLFSDTFDGVDSANINAVDSRSIRQAGTLAPANYDSVTLFSASADRSETGDSVAIHQGSLALTDNRTSGKGPASLAVGKLFPDSSGPFLVSAVLRPGKVAWVALKWGPQRNGNWPDRSPGIAVNITPGGTWTVWANSDGNMRNVIANGQVARSDAYPVTIAFAGAPGARRLSVSIGDLVVVSDMPVSYSGTGHNLVFQVLGGKDSGTAYIDNILVEKLVPGADNAVMADPAVGLWIEAEDTSGTNFHSGKVVSVDKAGPSGGMFLRLFTSPNNLKHPAPPYYAKYDVNVPVAGTYTLWIASTPNNTNWASPLTWSIDGSETVSLKGKGWTGAPWGKPSDRAAGWVFGWTNAGTVELDAGQHEIEIGVTEPRGSSNHYVASVDALLLTNSKSFLPVGSRPLYSPQPSWEERMKTTSERDFTNALNRRLYYELVETSNEQIDEAISAEVLAKIASRPLPVAKDRATDTTEFGLHGMERPFVSIRHNGDTPEVALAYELIARAGVDSLRTAESCWHRLATSEQREDTTKLHLDFRDLDFQVANAWKYGMTHLFTVGYPPATMTVARPNHHLSACDPKHYGLYSDYLDTVFSRYADQGLRWIEVGNEVDAPSVWWRNATPAQYVQEVKLARESARSHAPDASIVAFGSTYSRDEEHGGREGGRRFVSKSFDLGIDEYADAYSLHHITQLKTKDFPAYFRRELARTGNTDSLKKPLLNTEQNGGSYPYDGIKAFARCFFLHDMPRVDYFIARDFYENGSLLTWGLFDIDWRPKLRLLAYAFSVDSMRGRELVGIATPAPGVEAYVLKRKDSYEGASGDPIANATYSIVLWKTDREMNDWTDASLVEPVEVGAGLKDVKAAVDWKLDAIAFDPLSPVFSVGDAPLAIYTEQVPDWALITNSDYLADVDAGATEAPLPTTH